MAYVKKTNKKLKLWEKSPSTFQSIIKHINQMKDVKFLWVKCHRTPGVPRHEGNKAADKLVCHTFKRAAAIPGLR